MIAALAGDAFGLVLIVFAAGAFVGFILSCIGRF
jgi:Mg2+/citrate symporter